MKDIPIEERRELWTWRYAILSLKRCVSSCSQLLDQKLSKEHPLYLPLSASAQIFYARPFRKSYGIPTIAEESIIDPENRELHRQILAARDKLVAHLDATETPWWDGEPELEVYLFRTGRTIEVRVTEITPTFSQVEATRDLAQKLAPKCFQRVDNWISRWGLNVPTEADYYRVSLEPGPALVLVSDPTQQ